MRKTKIIVVANQKGGVGKSTLSFHLAHAAARGGHHTLCIDLDSQGNLSQFLTGDLDIIRQKSAIDDFLEGRGYVPMETSNEYIRLLHGHQQLDRYDRFPEVEERAYDGTLQGELRSSGYDFVVIDTPPDVGFRQLTALSWADVILIPTEPIMIGIAGFQNVLDILETKIAPLNQHYKWYGVVNRMSKSVKSHVTKSEWLKEKYGKNILAVLTSRTSVSDAMEEDPAVPVWERKGTPKALQQEWLTFCTRVIKG